jgi:hypothetical protein
LPIDLPEDSKPPMCPLIRQVLYASADSGSTRKREFMLLNVRTRKSHRTPRVLGLGPVACCLALCLGAIEAKAQETPEIAKQAQNPIASLISVPLENDFKPQAGFKKEDGYALEMKPVVPFPLSNDWNLITRTIIPVIQT